MQTHNLIAGQWTAAADGATIEVTNPATDEVIASVPRCGRDETRRAIEAAHAALSAWRTRPAHERGALLRTLAGLMMRDADRLARLMTLEQGKPLAEARGEIAYAASFLEWAAEEARRVSGEIIPASTTAKRILVLRQPVGVAAIITPWNFPSAMITRKLGPALAAGCTVVIKPAESTPLSAIAIGELSLEAGIPAGVVNIVTGTAREIGSEMCDNFLVRKLSFTGSTPVGRVLMQQASKHLLRLSLELGGHAPFIVFDDADLDAAAAAAITTKFRNAGQTCICANRFYVHASVHDAFVQRLAAATERLVVGNGLGEGVNIGPLIDDKAIAKVEEHVADATDRGARLVCGGSRVRVSGCADRFYRPTVLAGLAPEMKIAHEETFGPVAPVARFETEAEAIALANDSEYGLAAYFFTRDASRLIRVAEALDYGVIGANDAAPSTAQAPFGGMKHSGFGREGGHYVMDEYTEIKYVSWGV
ncbi:MAG: NAD-dependent succinate-semialdehyde dehydrogenase [Phycisphaeraceae bacterium]|nr:NAD-dependent succinate-semialdehyde dehydrogenase [Phycisphaeraceae bacterium]MCW5762774.1 NAD-dependent succinate-semialdehyde dehydrogenase [Phycisphaeraceae bacterium]